MVSVCLACYNGEKYIKEQISSILSQLGDDDELVISDDGSEDDTIEIVNSFHDYRIKVFANKDEHGFVGNFNNALCKANGDIIFLCDQDDIWLKDKVYRVSAYLERYDLVVHDANIVDGEGRLKGYTYYSTMHSGTGFLMNLWKTRFLGCCMAFRRSVLDACLPIPKNVVAHDYWIGMYSVLCFKVKFVPDVLISYRRHGENVSPSGEKSDTNIFFKLVSKRGVILYEIAKRLVASCYSFLMRCL